MLDFGCQRGVRDPEPLEGGRGGRDRGAKVVLRADEEEARPHARGKRVGEANGSETGAVKYTRDPCMRAWKCPRYPAIAQYRNVSK